LTKLDLSDQHRPWDEVDSGGRFEARCLAATLQQLRRLQELRLVGSLDDDNAADDDYQEAAAQLMRVLAELPQLRQLHLELDNDVGPAVVQLKASPQLTSLYCKSRSATDEQMQQLAAAGHVVKFDFAGDASSDDDD
jgi:arginine utilization protein RocB